LKERARLAIRHPPHYVQLLRFVVVGSTGFAMNLSVFSVLVHVAGVPYALAGVVGVVAGILDTYVFNRVWTFGAGVKDRHIEITAYFAVYSAGLAVSMGVLTLLVEVFGAPKVLAQATGALFALPVNFLGLRQWVFRRPWD
jgi:putative flippase GtrA